ncbi:avidin/streptavidin family protein [Trinickia sp. LjRoot230]|uniref:avidin/streptavidin family protein n=1 Tax=Trinickia sp. LjRoot230 TaxID=3342288 RepID=UPI003ECEAC99
MNWIGKWRNQYGSIVEIIDDANGKLAGMFRTALPDSAFYGQDVRISGIHQGNCVCFAAAGQGPAGDVIVSYTGMIREGRMETLWFVVADAALTASAAGEPAAVKKLNWWRSMTTSADTFKRVS